MGASLVAQMVKKKKSACNARDLSSIPGSGRSTGEGNGYPLQYSCLENSMDTAWRATVYGLQRIRHNWVINAHTQTHIYRRTRKCVRLFLETVLNQLQKYNLEQGGRGVGGCGIHLSPWIHQEYTFRHRTACTTPAENGQEYLTGGQEYIEPCKIQ